MNAEIIALANQKGGVGKSTTTVNLARAAVRRGLRVLVVDLDPQGNLTDALAAEPVSDDQVGLADVLSARADEVLSDVIVPSIWAGVDIAPTAGDILASVGEELITTGAGRESKLRKALAEVTDRYDLILVDCAPSLDQLTINGLTAAHKVLIVTQSKKWSLDGLAKLLRTIESVREHYNQSLQVAGVLVNQHEGRTIAGQTWLDELHAAAEARNFRVLTPPVPKRVVIADATEASVALDEWGSAEAMELSEMYADHLTTIQGVK